MRLCGTLRRGAACAPQLVVRRNKMALSKRNSRRIVVDGNSYRWSPAPDSGYITLVAQDELSNGRKLEVIVSSDENITIENGSYSIDVGGDPLLITPKLVEKIIRDSIEMGWKPKENGPPMELSLEENKLVSRRAPIN